MFLFCEKPCSNKITINIVVEISVFVIMRVIVLTDKFESAFFKNLVCRDVIFVDNGFDTLYIKRDFFIYIVSHRIIKEV